MHIFAKYCTPAPSRIQSLGASQIRRRTPSATPLLEPPSDAYLTQAALDKWATDTNGRPWPEETKEEMKGFLDVTDTGNLTLVILFFFFCVCVGWQNAEHIRNSFKGFVQIYQLQTENDEEETWRDLASVLNFPLWRFVLIDLQSNHGFDRSLTLVTSRREDLDGDERYIYHFSVTHRCGS